MRNPSALKNTYENDESNVKDRWDNNTNQMSEKGKSSNGKLDPLYSAHNNLNPTFSF